MATYRPNIPNIWVPVLIRAAYICSYVVDFHNLTNIILDKELR